MCRSMGYLIYKDDRFIVLAMNLHLDDFRVDLIMSFGDMIKIPMKNIRKIKKLKAYELRR